MSTKVKKSGREGATLCSSCDKWLIDNGSVNYMTLDRVLFKELDTLVASKVKIGNEITLL